MNHHHQEPTMACRKVSVILISLLLWSHIQAFQVTFRIRYSGSTHIFRAPCSSTRCLNALNKQDEKFLIPRDKNLSWISDNMRLALRSLARSKSVNGTLQQVNWRGEKAADEDNVDELPLGANWMEQVDSLLWDHELVKLQLNLAVGKKKLAKKLGERIAAKLNAHVAQSVGHTVLLYRPGIPPVLDLKVMETEKFGIDLRRANGFVCISSSSRQTVDFARDLARKRAEEKRKEGKLHEGHADYVCTLSKRILRKIPRRISEQKNSRTTESLIKCLCQEGIPAKTTERVKIGFHLQSFLGISSDLNFVSDETYWLVLVYKGTRSNDRRGWTIDLPGGKKELDETPFECAIRETEEEMSLQIDETWKLEENPRQTRFFNGNSYFFVAPPAEMLQSSNLDSIPAERVRQIIPAERVRQGIPAERVRQEPQQTSFVCVSSSDQQTVDFARDLARQRAQEKRKKGKLDQDHAQFVCTISKRTMWEIMGKRFTKQQKEWAKEFLVVKLSQQGVPVKAMDTVTIGFHLHSLLRMSELDSTLDGAHWLILANRDDTRSSDAACCWTIDLPNKRTELGETTFECAERATETGMSLQIDESWKLEDGPRRNQSHLRHLFFFVAPPPEMLAALNEPVRTTLTK